MKLGLVGCGHIGGSLALSLRQRGFVDEVIGFDTNPANAHVALERGICTALAPSLEALAADPQPGVVVLAVPVRAIPECARALALLLRPGCIVTDVGSTKKRIVEACESVLHPHISFVGGHPLAGTERAGPEAADPALFERRRVFLTPTAQTSSTASDRITSMWRSVGAEVLQVDAVAHDSIMAAVSHLPHVAAYSLVGAIGLMGNHGQDFIGLTGGGFTDTTRIASTPPGIWIDIFLENREALLPQIDELVRQLSGLRVAIAEGDGAAIERMLTHARRARQRILGQ